tara:strand:+ start:717 stop:914 length:198 start_codon:yes stop_codon:yes gene_type:complete
MEATMVRAETKEMEDLVVGAMEVVMEEYWVVVDSVARVEEEETASHKQLNAIRHMGPREEIHWVP